MGARGLNYNHAHEASSWTPSEIAESLKAEIDAYFGDEPLTDNYREYRDSAGGTHETADAAAWADWELEEIAHAERADAALAAIVSDPRWVAAQLFNEIQARGNGWLRMDLEIDRRVLTGLVRAGLVYSQAAGGNIRDIYPTAKGRRWMARTSGLRAMRQSASEEPWDIRAEADMAYRA